MRVINSTLSGVYSTKREAVGDAEGEFSESLLFAARESLAGNYSCCVGFSPERMRRNNLMSCSDTSGTVNIVSGKQCCDQ